MAAMISKSILAKKNDVLIAISTSGNSLNVIKVLKEARAKKITTIGFLGGSGGKCKKFCDIKLIVPSKITARIQECHIFLGHYILEKTENKPRAVNGLAALATAVSSSVNGINTQKTVSAGALTFQTPSERYFHRECRCRCRM